MTTQLSTVQREYTTLQQQHATLQSQHAQTVIERDHYESALHSEQRKLQQQMNELQTLQQLLLGSPLHAHLTPAEKVQQHNNSFALVACDK